MRSVCFIFQVHQPYRYRKYRFFDIGKDDYYYDDYANETILRKIADKSYLPANKVMLEQIKKHKGKFKITFSMSGIVLDQFKMYCPDVLSSFQELAATGQVEFLAETYPNSMVSLVDEKMFSEQIKVHHDLIQNTFGLKPKVLKNSELIYSDEIGEMAYRMGFDGMITEGAKHILGWKSPNFLYCNTLNPRLKLLMRHFRFSDDISFRFSNSSWSEYPLTADKFAGWVKNLPKEEEIINVFINYETFGQMQPKSSGIFEFFRYLPEKMLKPGGLEFATPSEVIRKHQPVSAIHVPHAISWADEERDLSAWLGNELQKEAFDKLYKLKDRMKLCKDERMWKDWNYLQSIDHFYYMCTKFFSDGEVHKSFNPYGNPYEAFINYMNVMTDFSFRLNNLIPKNAVEQENQKIKQAVAESSSKQKKTEQEIKKLKKGSISIESSTEKLPQTSRKKNINQGKKEDK
jgi:alpha-amylase